jgi:hypothetical protein
MLRTHRSLEGLLYNPVRKIMKMIRFFSAFSFNGAPMELNWQRKTEVPREKPVPVPLRPPWIPRGLTRDRTRASTVRGRRLTAWAMTRPQKREINEYQIRDIRHNKLGVFPCYQLLYTRSAIYTESEQKNGAGWIVKANVNAPLIFV